MAQEIVRSATAEAAELRAEIARTRVRQLDIAARLEVTEGHLSNVLNGKRPLSTSMAADIRAAIKALAA